MYAVIKNRVSVGDCARNIYDVMNPPGVYVEGKRQREYSITTDLRPMSGKLIPEFAGRRNIRDMFSKKPPLTPSTSAAMPTELPVVTVNPEAGVADDQNSQTDTILASPAASKAPVLPSKKRSASDATLNSKRAKSLNTAGSPAQNTKGQQTLKGFFSSKSRGTLDPVDYAIAGTARCIDNGKDDQLNKDVEAPVINQSPREAALSQDESASQSTASETFTNQLETTQITNETSPPVTPTATPDRPEKLHDPFESKESWSKLFAKPIAPRCEGHDEPCITLLTKKPGMNLGRSFWMCPRPLGPSGAKERNTQWRCQTFIWCSDWNPHAGIGM